MENCLLLRARGWGIDRQVKKKIANPRGCARGGGMVTGRIEPCIISRPRTCLLLGLVVVVGCMSYKMETN